MAPPTFWQLPQTPDVSVCVCVCVCVCACIQVHMHTHIHDVHIIQTAHKQHCLTMVTHDHYINNNHSTGSCTASISCHSQIASSQTSQQQHNTIIQHLVTIIVHLTANKSNSFNNLIWSINHNGQHYCYGWSIQ